MLSSWRRSNKPGPDSHGAPASDKFLWLPQASKAKIGLVWMGRPRRKGPAICLASVFLDGDEGSGSVQQNNSNTTRRLARLAEVAKEFFLYATVRLIVAVIQTLPLDMGNSICQGLAHLLAGPLRIRAKITDGNLRRVFPAADEASRWQLSLAMWHHLLLMVCEVAWAQRRLHLCNWSQYVRFRNPQISLRRLLDTRPVVTVTGHFGNFEIGGYTLGLMGIQSTTIARRLDNRFLHHWVARFRGAKGQHMVDKEGCAPLVQRHLENGGALSILADQHAGTKGCWVEFMGVPASCHKALALFSLSSGAPMMAGYTLRIDGQPMRFESACTAVADPKHDEEGACESVTTLTNWYNAHLTQAVARAVDQYWWLHRRWREPPPRVAQRFATASNQDAAGGELATAGRVDDNASS